MRCRTLSNPIHISFQKRGEGASFEKWQTELLYWSIGATHRDLLCKKYIPFVMSLQYGATYQTMAGRNSLVNVGETLLEMIITICWSLGGMNSALRLEKPDTLWLNSQTLPAFLHNFEWQIVPPYFDVKMCGYYSKCAQTVWSSFVALVTTDQCIHLETVCIILHHLNKTIIKQDF